MNASNEMTRLLDDLAAHWTEPALDILHAVARRPVSVATELEAWRALKAALRSELRWQHAFRSSTVASLGTLSEQVLRRAVLLVLRRHLAVAISYEVEAHVRQRAADRRSTDGERAVYQQVIRQPAAREAFKAPSRTDFVPRLRLSAVRD